MIRPTEPRPLLLHTVTLGGEDEAAQRLGFVTDRGTMEARLHPANGDAAVVWVFGSGGGLNGPAGGLYPRLAGQLQPDGVASLELAYRRPGRLDDCVADTVLGIDWLSEQGKRRIALVGHSFGGAVVISAAAARRDSVAGVAALSSQSGGTGAVGALSPVPVLFVHGTADEILPDACSRDLYARAEEPKQLILYKGCRHGLDECRDELDRDLAAWLRRVLPGQA